MSRKLLAGILLVLGIFLIFFFWNFFMQNSSQKTEAKIRYVALGDSYSNGEGESPQDAWPVLLTEHLREAGYDIELIANPSVSGYTTQNLIDQELPIFIDARPNFATVLIGANDLFQGIAVETIYANFVSILDTMQANMPDEKKIVIVTIPDYSVSPQGKMYKPDPNEQKRIEAYNTLLKTEGKKRGLPVVDIFLLTQAMGSDSTLVTPDGLHPSKKELILWEEKIYPVVERLLKE